MSAHAAQTGHLIIATVHSNDNLGTIDRLVNLGIPLRSVAATLQLIGLGSGWSASFAAARSRWNFRRSSRNISKART